MLWLIEGLFHILWAVVKFLFWDLWFLNIWLPDLVSEAVVGPIEEQRPEQRRPAA